jgi:hypothetical protein
VDVPPTVAVICTVIAVELCPTVVVAGNATAVWALAEPMAAMQTTIANTRQPLRYKDSLKKDMLTPNGPEQQPSKKQKTSEAFMVKAGAGKSARAE